MHFKAGKNTKISSAEGTPGSGLKTADVLKTLPENTGIFSFRSTVEFPGSVFYQNVSGLRFGVRLVFANMD